MNHPHIEALRQQVQANRDELDDHEAILLHLFECDVPDYDWTTTTRYWAQYASWYADLLAESDEYWEPSAMQADDRAAQADLADLEAFFDEAGKSGDDVLSADLRPDGSKLPTPRKQPA